MRIIYVLSTFPIRFRSS